MGLTAPTNDLVKKNNINASFCLGLEHICECAHVH